jgi:hypothetical protein
MPNRPRPTVSGSRCPKRPSKRCVWGTCEPVLTYSFGTRTDAQRQIPKVDLLARELTLSGRLEVLPVRGTAQDLRRSTPERPPGPAW